MVAGKLNRTVSGEVSSCTNVKVVCIAVFFSRVGSLSVPLFSSFRGLSLPLAARNSH